MQKIVFKKWHVLTMISLGAVLLIVLIVRGCGASIKMAYDYETLSRGDVKKTISATGTLDLANMTIVKSRIPGEVLQLSVDFNQNVHKGQLLLLIRADDIDRAVTASSDAIERAKLDFLDAQSAYDAKKSLFRESMITQKEMDAAERGYKRIQMSYNQAKVNYSVAVENQRNRWVYAPVSGIIVKRTIELNRSVAPGTELFYIADNLKKMQLIINVDESDVGFVKTGQQVEFTVSAFPDKVFRGKIDQLRMTPVTKNGIVTYESLVVCDNSELLLRPGMTATAMLIVDSRKNVLRVQSQALTVAPIDIEAEEGKHYLWKKLRNGSKEIPVKRYEVKVGLIGDNYAEIVPNSDISEGDKILINAHKKIDVGDALLKNAK